MGDEALWGLLIAAYLFPFWLWQLRSHLRVDARKRLAPDDPIVQEMEDQITRHSLVWSCGFAALLGAWHFELRPVGTAVVLAAGGACAFALKAANARWKLLSSLPFRLWLVGYGAWVLSVASWYLIFGRGSDLQEGEALVLAVLPPLILAGAGLGFKWAMHKP